MNRRGKRIRTRDQALARAEDLESPQTMWEDRWVLVGNGGRADGFLRLGRLLPVHDPNDSTNPNNPKPGPFLILRGVRGLSPGLAKGRVRRTW